MWITYNPVYDTVNTEAPPLGDAQAVPCGRLSSVLDQILFHDCGKK
jgi:hypothetical protein